MITLENYFKISELLSKSKTIDFELYRSFVFKNKLDFGANAPEKILNYYNYAKKDKKQAEPHFLANLAFYKTLLYALAFFFGIVLGFFLIDTTLDINKFLFWSLLLPFLFMLLSFFQLLTYRYH